MGRLAGPSFAQSITKSWKQRVEEAREEKQRNGSRRMPKLLSIPSGARRQLALLWWLTRWGDDRRAIGRQYAPPLTADMRHLIAKGLARLEREMPTPASNARYQPLCRTTYLVITPAGREVLTRATITPSEMDYVSYSLLR